MKSTPIPRKQKAANGLHEVVTTPPGPSAGRGLLRGALQAGGDAAIPGLGTAVGLVDDASGLLKNTDGVYSNRFNQALDGLNPVEQLSRLGGGLTKTFQGDFKGASGAFAGDQTDLKQKLAQQKFQQGYVGANEQVGGIDPTTSQRSTYEQGTHSTQSTKPIEVEKDELVFRKVGDKYRLKADFKGGKSHKQGGEDYTAQEGDIIFPGKQRSKVLGHYKEGNHSALEGMRMRLPVDSPTGKAAYGLDYQDPDPFNISPTQPLPSRYAPGAFTTNKANRYGAYGAFPQAVNGLATGESEYLAQNPLASRPEDYRGPVIAYKDPRNRGGMTSNYQVGLPQPMALKNPLATTMEGIPAQLQGNGQAFQSLPLPSQQAALPSLPGVEGAGMGNLLKYASVANNLIQGFSKPETVQENYLDPTLLQYQDRSDPLRRQSNMVATQQGANARNASGGNVSNLRGNQQIAQADNFNRRQRIDNQEQVRADQVTQYNTEQVGRTKAINSGKRDQYAQLNAQGRANAQAYKDAAFGQLTSLGQANEQEGYQRSRDAKLDARDQTALGYLNQMTHYQTDGNGNIQWNPQGSGYLGGLGSTTTSQKVDTDVYGRVKSSSTTSTKSANSPSLKRRKK